MARFACTAKAAVIQRLPDSRRLATLVAFVMNLEASALDDSLDLLDILITEMFANAERASDRARLRTIKDLDFAAIQLSQVGRLILNDGAPDSELRAVIFDGLKHEDLESALNQIDSIVRPPEDVYYKELQDSYPRIRRFLPSLLRTLQFGSTPAGQPVIEALNHLAHVEEQGRVKAFDAPLQIVTRGWRRYVLGTDGFDNKAYVFCCLDRLRLAPRRRDVFVAPSIRYADARLGLLNESAWQKARPTIARSLGHSLSASETLNKLAGQLNATYTSVARNLPSNPLARVEEVDGKPELVVTAIDKAEEPGSLIKLREEVNARLPRVDLPELLLEIAARTNFTSKFTHISERESRMSDLPTSLCACLIADACNIGPEPLIRSGVPALRRARLSWVSQNFIRNETLTEANVCLVAEQNRIPLVR